ncbi:hypothetical protein [Nocardia brevicatena]|uniref:hypothetical protein n=1 Tax=Nocardia brevicatena TaxID=37327 RepID=UPI0012F80068|nr:hypothetical protein [Nocardia brevicatena]
MRWYSVAPCGPESFTALADGFLPMAYEFGEADGWCAVLAAPESKVYTLLRWDQGGTRSCNRTGRHVRDIPGDDFYWVVVPERDVFSLRFRDDVLRVPPTHAIVAGREVPCRLHIPYSAAYALQVPRTEFDHRVRSRGHIRLVLDMRRGLGRIAGGYDPRRSRRTIPALGREFNAVCDRLTELLCLMAAGETQPQRSHHAEVAERVRQYLRANLGRADVRSSPGSRRLRASSSVK